MCLFLQNNKLFYFKINSVLLIYLTSHKIIYNNYSHISATFDNESLAQMHFIILIPKSKIVVFTHHHTRFNGIIINLHI